MEEIDVDSKWIEKQLKEIGDPPNIILVESYLIILKKENWHLGMDEILAKALDGAGKLALIVNTSKRAYNHQAITHWIVFTLQRREEHIAPVRIYDPMRKLDHGAEEIATIIYRAASKIIEMDRVHNKLENQGKGNLRTGTKKSPNNIMSPPIYLQPAI